MIGAARCASPAGPCRKQAAPALDDRRHPGAGGAELVAGTALAVLHEWAPGRVGYDAGGHRRIRLAHLDDACGPLRLTVIPAAESASRCG